MFDENGTLGIENQVLHFEDYPGSKTQEDQPMNLCRWLRQPVFSVQGILVGIIYDKYGSLHRAKCDAFGLLLTYWIGNPLLNYLVKAKRIWLRMGHCMAEEKHHNMFADSNPGACNHDAEPRSDCAKF